MSMSSAEFKVGDKAVYPAQGVAEVVDIEEKDIAGRRQRFYILRIVDTDRKVMIPVGNADAIGLRPLISAQQAQELFDILCERPAPSDHQTWNRRYRAFLDKIKSGSIYDVAEVLRDLYRVSTDRPLSYGERRMFTTARTLLGKEVAIVLHEPEEAVTREIEGIFFAARSGPKPRRHLRGPRSPRLRTRRPRKSE
jgi:CarD family transcriptional regulator